MNTHFYIENGVKKEIKVVTNVATKCVIKIISPMSALKKKKKRSVSPIKRVRIAELGYPQSTKSFRSIRTDQRRFNS